MAAREGWAELALEIQRRLGSAWPVMPRKAPELRAAIVGCLIRSSNARLLKDGAHDIQRKVKLTQDARTNNRYLITGGLIDGTRFGRKDRFTRDDDAVFDFSIALQEGVGTVELLAYDFHIELPTGLGPPFLRFDLNMPDHGNEELGLRSHVHPGVDEDQLIVPSPVMSPVEILTLFVQHLRRSDRRRSDRREFRRDPDET